MHRKACENVKKGTYACLSRDLRRIGAKRHAYGPFYILSTEDAALIHLYTEGIQASEEAFCAAARILSVMIGTWASLNI